MLERENESSFELSILLADSISERWLAVFGSLYEVVSTFHKLHLLLYPQRNALVLTESILNKQISGQQKETIMSCC